MLLEAIIKYGVSALVGIVIGLIFILWTKPTTNGGTALLLAICIILSIIIGHVVGYIFNRRKRRNDQPTGTSVEGKRRIWKPGDD